MEDLVLPAQVLGKEGADPITSGNFYLTVFQEVLLFGAETWVSNPNIGRLLGSFHNGVSIWLAGVQPRRRTDGIWNSPLLDDALQAAGLETIETYISRGQNEVAQYIM